MMLAEGKYKGMIASTIPEIKGALPLVEEGLVEEVMLSPDNQRSKLTEYSVCMASQSIQEFCPD